MIQSWKCGRCRNEGMQKIWDIERVSCVGFTQTKTSTSVVLCFFPAPSSHDSVSTFPSSALVTHTKQTASPSSPSIHNSTLTSSHHLPIPPLATNCPCQPTYIRHMRRSNKGKYATTPHSNPTSPPGPCTLTPIPPPRPLPTQHNPLAVSVSALPRLPG